MSDPARPYSAARLLDAFSKVPAHVAVVTGPDHLYAFINDAFGAVVGLDEPIGKPFGSANHETSAALRAVLDRVYTSGEPWATNELLVAGIGRERTDRYFNVNFIPLRGEGDAIDGVLIHSFDVTELVRARQAMATNEARLRRLVEGNIVGIGFWDDAGALTEANDELLRLLASSQADVDAGRLNWRDMIPPEHAADAERVRVELSTVGRFAPFETEIVRRDASRAPVLFGGAAFASTSAAGAGVVLDLTERRRAEREHAALQAQLLHVQKLESLGVLAGGIAHDFNNMLTAVQGAVSVAALMLASESPVQPVLRDAFGAVRRAADLTRQLLAYSGKGRFRVERMDLSAQVAELAHLLEATLAKKVQLRLDLRADLPAIEADPAQLQQIVMNLVLNGAEAIGDARGTVVVTTGVDDVDAGYTASLYAPGDLAPGRYVYLEVVDTGCGMDEPTQAKIFDPFFTTKFTGRGLGLAAVLGIVRAHKGGLSVSSAPGKGTTFKVLFATVAGEADTRRRTPSDDLRASGLVLVIDDDVGVRLVLRRLLEHFGFDVIEAEDGRKGVAAFEGRARDVRLVILDMTMPELGGEETFRELRRVRQEVPVILSSGYSETEATTRFGAKELAGFLPKPFTPDDLARCLRAALTKP